MHRSSGIAGAPTITCRATPNDGKNDGSVGESSVIVVNTLPSVDSVTLNTPVYTNGNLTATVSFSDADSSQSLSGTYAWHVIDASTGIDTEVQNGSSNTLSGSTYFDRDDEVYVVVTPYDGVATGSPLSSSSVTISNSTPTEPLVSISPSNPTQGVDDLLCTIVTESQDADGDTLYYTYTWSDSQGTQQTTTEVKHE